MTFFRNARTGFGHRSQIPMTEDAMRRIAPSIFAETAHESRSARYTYIPTIEILRGLMREGFQPMAVAQGRTRVEGKAEFTKHMIKLRRVTDLTAIGQEVPEISLINSHDGTSSYEFIAGYLRLACLNGLLVSSSVMESVKVAHKGDVLDNVIEGAFTVVNNYERANVSKESMKAITLDSNEQRVFASAALTARFGTAEERTDSETGRVTPIPMTTEQALRVVRREDTGADLWTTFNRVQETLVNGGVRHAQVTATGRRNRTRAVTGISQNVSLNRALWELAEGMRQIKAA